MLLTQLCNTLVAVHGGKASFKVSDFTGEGSRRMDQRQLYAMAVAAFGPPPKSQQAKHQQWLDKLESKQR